MAGKHVGEPVGVVGAPVGAAADQLGCELLGGNGRWCGGRSPHTPPHAFLSVFFLASRACARVLVRRNL